MASASGPTTPMRYFKGWRMMAKRGKMNSMGSMDHKQPPMGFTFSLV